MQISPDINISIPTPQGWKEIDTVEGRCYQLPHDQSVIFYISCVEITSGSLSEFINHRIIFSWQKHRKFLYHSAYITATDLCGDRITFKITDQGRCFYENSYIFPATQNKYICITSVVYDSEYGHVLQKAVDECIDQLRVNQL